MFGPLGWTKSGPHKHELIKFYSKLELRRALLIYIKFGVNLIPLTPHPWPTNLMTLY